VLVGVIEEVEFGGGEEVGEGDYWVGGGGGGGGGDR